MPPITGTVLVVDDDAAVRQSLKFVLEQEGLEVGLYEGSAQLLADEALPSSGCLVIDLTMPGIDGIDLMDRLRGRHVDLPAILITTPAGTVPASARLARGLPADAGEASGGQLPA